MTVDLAALKAEMAKWFGPCKVHGLYHDLTRQCWYCRYPDEFKLDVKENGGLS